MSTIANVATRIERLSTIYFGQPTAALRAALAAACRHWVVHHPYGIYQFGDSSNEDLDSLQSVAQTILYGMNVTSEERLIADEYWGNVEMLHGRQRGGQSPYALAPAEIIRFARQARRESYDIAPLAQADPRDVHRIVCAANILCERGLTIAESAEVSDVAIYSQSAPDASGVLLLQVLRALQWMMRRDHALQVDVAARLNCTSLTPLSRELMWTHPRDHKAITLAFAWWGALGAQQVIDQRMTLRDVEERVEMMSVFGCQEPQTQRRY